MTPAASGTASSVADETKLFVSDSDSSRDDEQPSAKKLKVNDSGNGVALPLPSGKRGNKVVTPRSPLPIRSTRVINPGYPDKKNARRTSAQVAAENEKKEALRRDLDAIRQRPTKILAELEIGLEKADEAERQDVIRSLNDIQAIEEDIEMAIGISGSENGGDTDDNSENDITIMNALKAPTGSKKKKARKGETRAALDATKAAIIKRNLKKASEKKRSKKGKSTILSGMVPGWESKGNYCKRGSTIPAHPSEEQRLGGLKDEDSYSVQPTFEATHAKNRVDCLVVVDSGVPDERKNSKMTTLSRHSRVRAIPIYCTTSVSASVNDENSTSGLDTDNLPVFARAKWSKMQTMGPLSSSTNSNHEFETDGLPAFARVKWATCFLLTLYALLGSTSNPWKLYENGSSMVDTIQSVLNMVYPNSGYNVKFGNRIFSMAKDHLDDKCAYFGREGTKIVTRLFQSDRYAGNHRAIANYANWATRSNGPAVWGSPTPINCVVPQDHSDYMNPEDLFESEFVIELVSPYVKWCEGSCHDYGHLKGAFAMATAAIKCGFRMYHSGECLNSGQFSWELVGEMVDEYAANATIMSNQRWIKLIKICGGQGPKNEDHVPVSLSMQKKCRTPYVPSSPSKDKNSD